MTTQCRELELLASALLLAACDGPSVDPSTVITVHTTDHAGGPVAGVVVYGHDGAGAMVDQAVTDADGLAILSVPAGGSITTHEHDPQVPADVVTHHWSSVLGVEPGDNLEVPVDRGVALRRQVPVTDADLDTGSGPDPDPDVG